MKIYIICPYKKSGGPRSLHQLGNKLIDRGIDTYVYYGYRGIHYETDQLLYADSKMKIAENIEDRKENMLIVPEIDTGWLNNFHNVKGTIWWLSLHFYLENNIWRRSKFRTKLLGQPHFFAYLRYFRDKLKEPVVNYVTPENLRNVTYHLYNCEYVHDYLLKQGVQKSKMSYLCGPIDIKEKDNFLINKGNLILYNPAKASPYILRKVLKYMKDNYPNYELKALHNLSHKDVLQYLASAKVYLDLGYFPGPERIPREASMSYCNIITSTMGAAANDEDVPIPQKFKFALNKKNVPKICKLMVDMCNNYNEYLHYYDRYRDKTLSQINNFDLEINNFIKALQFMQK